MRFLLLIVIFAGVAAAPGEEKPAPAAPTPKERAAEVARQLEKAIEAYFKEYRRFPSIGANTPGTDTATDSGAELMEILTAKDKKQNPRQIGFFPLKKANRLDESGNLLDPWGKPYRVIIDTDYNSRITVDGKVRPGKIHVESLGPDSGR